MNRRIRTVCLALWGLIACASCTQEVDHKGKTPLVEVDGQFLYREDLVPVIPVGLPAADSVRFAEEYMRTWAEDVLLYDKARRNIRQDGEIERLVEAYRKDLVMNRYQQELVNQKLAGDISEQELESYYLDNRQLFTVDRPLIKGLFIKVPLTAPHVANVRRWYRQEEREAVEHLEKYSLRNAVKYEYFYDKWVPVAEVLDLLPLKHAEPETYLEKNRHVELKDTAFYYFLNVSDYRAVGEPEPYEVARAHARDMLLNTRRAAFLRQVRHDLYDNALESNDIVYYIGRTEQR